jgi:hypothetical protein
MMQIVLALLLSGSNASHHRHIKPKPIDHSHILWPVVAAARKAGKHIETCLAGVYATPSDVKSHGKTATGQDPTVVAGIAHRTLRLKSLVTVCAHRVGKCVDTNVIDRGPYGKLAPDGQWFNGAREPERVGHWRGCVDMSAPLAEMLGVSNLTAVTLIVH